MGTRVFHRFLFGDLNTLGPLALELMPNILTCACVSLITKMKAQEESPRLRSYSIRHVRTILVDRLLKGRGMGETPPNLTP